MTSIAQKFREAAARGDAPIGDWIEAGYFEVRGERKQWLPMKCWYGPPLDPETGEEMDRSWRWQCMIDGRLIDDWMDAWPPTCRATEERYEMMLAGEPGRIVTRVDFNGPEKKSREKQMEN